MPNITNHDKIKDLTLWNLIIEGDRKALEMIYQRYYILLLNYGLRYTSDRELIKDCIHDLYIKIFKNKNINIKGITVRAYLLKALKNNIFNRFNTMKRVQDSLDSLSFEISIEEDLFEQMFPKSDKDIKLIQNLINAISQLSSHQKTILYLRYVKDLSHKEIAYIMGMNIQSSMNLINRALLKLRTLMKNKGIILEIGQLIVLLKTLYTIY